ncbi:MAG: alanine racemase [Candidatus Gastranaerophilales bacterium]|nr:alanine racemase [Candidatus Gastranaerophilales bacterium]
MQNFRGTFVNTNRDAWVEINLSNLEHNVLKIKDFLEKNTTKTPELFAVIKADAYGHGSLMCAPILEACGVDTFGVASIDEGIELRSHKIKKPILVLGASPLWAFENAIKNNISISIFNDEHLDMAQQLFKRLNKKLKAHIKIDTGMNRIGIDFSSAQEYIKKVLNSEYIELQGVFTHFADVENEKIFKRQIDEFNSIIEPFKDTFKSKNIKIHCLNSQGIFMYPKYSYDMVRMGIIMWGLSPFATEQNYPEMLPVMGLKARITNIHTLKKGDGISYGHTHIAKKDTKVITLPLGYADGIDRRLSDNICAILNGQKIKQIGRITMDQIMFDASDIDCSIGDVVTILGEENKNDTIDTWAQKLGTINYELTCRLKMRVGRIYTR